jgi:putative Ca2+/H+ antiporter (TMEM165/GDT1 family)
MTATRFGIILAAILAIVWIWAGFWPMVGLAAAMAIGALVGRIVEGKLDVRALSDAVRGKRSSS